MGKAARLKARRRQAAGVRQGPGPAALQEAAYPPEHQAAHEAGHAVVHWTLGIRFDYVSLDTDPPGVWPLAGARPQLGEKWLIGAAGCISDYQSRDLVMLDVDILRLIVGSPDSRFNLTGRSGVTAVRPDRRPAVMPGGDLRLMAAVMTDRGDGHPWPAGAIIDIWRSCERYVAACTPAITAVAAALLVCRRLTYSEASSVADEASVGVSRPALPQWFEDAQALGRRIESEAS